MAAAVGGVVVVAAAAVSVSFVSFDSSGGVVVSGLDSADMAVRVECAVELSEAVECSQPLQSMCAGAVFGDVRSGLNDNARKTSVTTDERTRRILILDADC